jgi:hypothetical protein
MEKTQVLLLSHTQILDMSRIRILANNERNIPTYQPRRPYGTFVSNSLEQYSQEVKENEGKSIHIVHTLSNYDVIVNVFPNY